MHTLFLSYLVFVNSIKRWANTQTRLSLSLSLACRLQDRCHRLGQEKDVHVVYFDSAATIDEMMAELNKRKKQNSAILLADCVEIGHRQGLSYTELSGLIRSTLDAIRSYRTAWLQVDPEGRKDQPIPPVPQEIINDAINGKLSANKKLKKRNSLSDEESKESDRWAQATGLEDFIVPDDIDDEEEAEFDGRDSKDDDEDSELLYDASNDEGNSNPMEM